MFLKPAFVLTSNVRGVKRWVSATLKEIRSRKRKYDTTNTQIDRKSFLDWNYKAEVFACSRRFNENFDINTFQTAFVHKSFVVDEYEKQKKLGIFDENVMIEDNKHLIELGNGLIKNYVDKFLTLSLPKIPKEGVNAVKSYLVSDELLSNLCKNLGMEELILTSENSPSTFTLSDTFKAVVGALVKSSGTERAELFVKDFICTQLNQQDLFTYWHIENPTETLKVYCKTSNLGDLEPRLLGDTGKNTILSTYHVGIYLNKKLLGAGFGENITKAIDSASQESLSEIFGLKSNNVLFNFKDDCLNKV